jgi:nitrite reductase/ring-hydroxylating ferredoxin subunit
MPATQINPLSPNPNQLELRLVASYPRRIRASLARVWENVLDWEHLPHLHDGSFSYCELQEAGSWGWRVWSDADHNGHIELVVDEECYVARSYAGGEQFSEIWTHLAGQGDETDIRVEFYSTGVSDDNSAEIGAFYLGLYKVLWDEDEAMMRERQQRLLQQRKRDKEVRLGRVEQLQAQLQESGPLCFELSGREYALRQQGRQWVALPTICPHLLGPLAAGAEPGQVRCPWHGYVFDLQTGHCVTPAESRCSLGLPPEITIQAGEVIARAR